MDLNVWTQIGTILNNESLSFFTSPNTPAYRSFFYRLNVISRQLVCWMRNSYLTLSTLVAGI